MIVNLIKQQNVFGGKYTYIIQPEPDKDKEMICIKCGKKLKANDWIRLERNIVLDTGKKEYNGRIYCFKCSEDMMINGMLGLIVDEVDLDDES